MSFRSKALLLLSLAVVYYLNPLYIRSSAFSFARTVHGYVDLTPYEDPESLQVAIANVTSDITQLTAILNDFFQRQQDKSTEASFKEFLRRKASSTKHRDLEYYLDWILGFYKFAWPFVLVYALMKISAAKGDRSDASDGAPKRRKKVGEEAKPDKLKKGHLTSDDSGLNSVIRDERIQRPLLQERRLELKHRSGSAQSLQ